MSLTIGQIVMLVIIGLIGLFLTVALGVYQWDNDETQAWTVLSFLLTIGVIVGVMFFCNWKNTSTASGIRQYKDYQSNLANGIEREIIITAEDGREIFHYEGKVDIESNHADNYIKFESEEGKRYIIYYGITDTIIIKEK